MIQKKKKFFSHYHLPEFMSVYVSPDADSNHVAKQLIVEVVRKPITKPFVGGYLNKKTC